VRFLLDNNLPPAFARALHALTEKELPGHDVQALRDRFKANTEDPEWIEMLSAEGDWVVVTQDKLNKGLEREALRRAGLIVFLLDKSWASQKYWEKATQLIRWWPRIVEWSGGMRGGAAFRVPWHLKGKGQFEQIRL